MFSSKAFHVGFLIILLCSAILLVNIIHFQCFTVHVVLYDSMADALIACALIFGLHAIYLWRLLDLTRTEAVLCFTIGILCGAIYAVCVPTIIDRSLSIYLLEKIDQRGGGIRQDAFEEVFKEEYMPEDRLVDIRLTEQVNSGTIVIKDGCVVLTAKGRVIVAFTRFYRKNLLPKHREVMGQLTDALTDPFRNSRTSVTYQCSTGAQN